MQSSGCPSRRIHIQENELVLQCHVMSLFVLFCQLVMSCPYCYNMYGGKIFSAKRRAFSPEGAAFRVKWRQQL